MAVDRASGPAMSPRFDAVHHGVRHLPSARQASPLVPSAGGQARLRPRAADCWRRGPPLPGASASTTTTSIRPGRRTCGSATDHGGILFRPSNGFADRGIALVVVLGALAWRRRMSHRPPLSIDLAFDAPEEAPETQAAVSEPMVAVSEVMRTTPGLWERWDRSRSSCSSRCRCNACSARHRYRGGRGAGLYAGQRQPSGQGVGRQRPAA